MGEKVGCRPIVNPDPSLVALQGWKLFGVGGAAIAQHEMVADTVPVEQLEPTLLREDHGSVD